MTRLEPFQALAVAVLALLAIVANVVFWFRFWRMMNDVRKIADTMAPPPKPIEELRRDHLYKEFRDDGATKQRASSRGS